MRTMEFVRHRAAAAWTVGRPTRVGRTIPQRYWSDWLITSSPPPRLERKGTAVGALRISHRLNQLAPDSPRGRVFLRRRCRTPAIREQPAEGTAARREDSRLLTENLGARSPLAIAELDHKNRLPASSLWSWAAMFARKATVGSGDGYDENRDRYTILQ